MLSLLKSLSMSKLEEGVTTMKDHIRGVRQTADELAEIEVKLDKIAVMGFMLNGLPDSYRYLVVNLELQIKKISYEELSARLLDEEKWIGGVEESKEDVNGYLSISKADAIRKQKADAKGPGPRLSFRNRKVECEYIVVDLDMMKTAVTRNVFKRGREQVVLVDFHIRLGQWEHEGMRSEMNPKGNWKFGEVFGARECAFNIVLEILKNVGSWNVANTSPSREFGNYGRVGVLEICVHSLRVGLSFYMLAVMSVDFNCSSPRTIPITTVAVFIFATNDVSAKSLRYCS